MYRTYIKYFGLVLIVLNLAACTTGSKNTDEQNTQEGAADGMSGSGTEDFFEDVSASESEAKVLDGEAVLQEDSSTGTDGVVVDSSSTMPESDPVSSSEDQSSSVESQQIAPSNEIAQNNEVNNNDGYAAASTQLGSSGQLNEYTVQKDETLMWIAFKLYGDYRKWKEIASLNQAKLAGSKELKEGMVLTHNAPNGGFQWDRKGEPYLIQWGDTLGKISNKVYNTTKRWKNIWENNRPMIKDPNRIFAGFTLYYLSASDLVANQ